MMVTGAIRNLIREGKTHQFSSAIMSGGTLGMQTLDQDLRTLVEQKKVTYEAAVGKASSAKEFAALMGRQPVTA